jgi:predicted nucleic acid-binding protein
MIAGPVILDTGPLVAISSKRDAFHDVCRRQADEIAGPVLTTWLVMTEAAWLLRHEHSSLEALLNLVSAGHIECQHLDLIAVHWMKGTAAKYADLSPQLADLSLLYLAEHHRTRNIFTLDRRDFLVYRTAAGEPFNLLPPLS